MSARADWVGAPEPTDSPAALWTSAGRLAAGATLVLGAGLELAANAIGPQWSSTTLEDLQWAVDHPGVANLVFVLALLAVPFLVGTALVYVLLSRRRSPRLAYAGGILLGFGLVSLSAVEGFQTLAVALAGDGRFEVTALADALEDATTPAVVAMFVMFVPFAFFGLLLSAAALWRSRAVPRAAVLLIPAFMVVDFFLYEGLGIAPSFAGPAIAFVAACWIAWSAFAANARLAN